jgi:RHS repeat-associated protein
MKRFVFPGCSVCLRLSAIVFLFSGAAAWSATNPPPVFTALSMTETGEPQIDVSGRAGKVFRIEAGESPTNWSLLDSFTAYSSNFTYVDGLPEDPPKQMYRLLMLPGTNPPTWDWTLDTGLDVALEEGTNVIFRWQPAEDLLELAGYRIYLDGVLLTNLPSTSFSYRVTGLATGVTHTVTIEAGNEDDVWSTNGPGFAIRTGGPEPEEIAPPPDNGVVGLIAENAAFLYSGPDAVQTGVDTNALEAIRTCVLRGRVLDRSDAPLPGVVVTVESHPEYGLTVTRTNGWFDLVVNGGAALYVNYDKAGFLPLQRPVAAPWQAYAELPDAVMIPADTNATVLDLSAGGLKVARGGTVSDGDGQRRASVLIPEATAAAVYGMDGALQPVSALTTRFTEYTVGTNGLAAMPGELPPGVAYTYAVELGADETIRKIDGRDVVFDRPVYLYLENFLGFPAGSDVPVGYYDRDSKRWLPSPNGRVIQLVGTNAAGLAEIDTDGDAAADDPATLAALGFTDEERMRLALDYAPTQSLWRVAITHFSTYDFNWPSSPPADAPYPTVPEYKQFEIEARRETTPAVVGGQGVIDVDNQIFREFLPVAGTPFRLCYSSDRSLDAVTLPLTGEEIHTNLLVVEAEVKIEGRAYRQTFAADTNLEFTAYWDGLDVYGRPAYGRHKAECTLIYHYPNYYFLPAGASASFGMVSGRPFTNPVLGRETVPYRQSIVLYVGGWNANALGLGGWSLDVHHAYDPVSETLYRGNGSHHNATDVTRLTRIWAGTGIAGYSGDGGPAENATFRSPRSLATGPDGSVYVADFDNHCVRRIDPEGIIRTVAGTGVSGFSGDGGPAELARLYWPCGIDVASDGTLYIADFGNGRVRKVDPRGTIATLAGNGTFGFSGDGGPATNAALSLGAVAARDDGTVFLADASTHRIRRVGPDGIISTVAGTGSADWTGDGGPAIDAAVRLGGDMEIGPNGELYFVQNGPGGDAVRRLANDGRIYKVAGNPWSGIEGDGGPATNAAFDILEGIGFDLSGNLYIADRYSGRIRMVGTDGIIDTVAGSGASGYMDAAVTPDGRIFVADDYRRSVRTVEAPMPGYSARDIQIGSAAGDELYVFAKDGRHLATYDAVTGAKRYDFHYTDGWLTGIVDAFGLATTLERDGNGKLTGIVGPYGQRTAAAIDGNGHLAAVVDPSGATNRMTYTTNGLLTAVIGPEGQTYGARYADGRLAAFWDPGGATTTLSRARATASYEVAMTTALGRVSRLVYAEGAAASHRTLQTPDGLTLQIWSVPGGSATNQTPDGMTVVREVSPDPRFDMQALLVSTQTVATPGGLAATRTLERQAALADPDDPLSVVSLATVATLNGRTLTAAYDAATRTLTRVSPMGRTNQIAFTAQGLYDVLRLPGLPETVLSYDAAGRLTAVVRGSGTDVRTAHLGYDGVGQLAYEVWPIAVSNAYAYDAVGRLTNVVFIDGRNAAFARDRNGNVIRVTTPAGPQHVFAYDALNLLTNYAAPDVGGTVARIAYAYNLERQLTAMTRPDGSVITNFYDAAGRLAEVRAPDNALLCTYDGGGRLQSMVATDGGGSEWTYDGFLPISESWSGFVTGVVSRCYDANFAVTSQTVNGRYEVALQYDLDGLLIQAGELAIQRSPEHGRITGTALGAATDTRTYNAFGEPAEHVAAFGTGTWSLVWQRDALGRITNEVETLDGAATTNAFAYDAALHLAEVRTNGSLRAQYEYDANGNLTNRLAPAGTTAAAYDACDRLVSRGTVVYANDANGFRTNGTDGAETAEYAFDGLGRLIAAKPAGQTNIYTYVVDGRMRRTARLENGVATRKYLYMNHLNPIAELDGAGGVISRFVYGTRGNVPDYLVRSGTVYRILSDSRGSPRLVVDAATGAVAQRLAYDPLGRVEVDTNPGFQPFGFAGGLYDPDTGLVKIGVRNYDPETGRWLSPDPLLLGGGTLNAYEYAWGDPINLIDPTGLGPVPAERRPLGWNLRDVATAAFPDYVCFDVGLGAVSGTITVDRYGRIYQGGGGLLTGDIDAGISLRGGYLATVRGKGHLPTNAEMKNFLEGWSASGFAACLVGVGGTVGASGASAEVGFGFGISAGAGYTQEAPEANWRDIEPYVNDAPIRPPSNPYNIPEI